MYPISGDIEIEITDLNIEDMNFSVRTYHCLKKAKIHTLVDLTKRTVKDLLKIRNLGRKSVEEISFKLKLWGLKLKEKNDER